VRHFVDRQVGAVSGNARVGNKQKWITKFQSITVVPGAVGAWRKRLIVACG
jgi:hypothetical protein